MKLLHIPTGSLCIGSKKKMYVEFAYSWIHILEDPEYKNCLIKNGKLGYELENLFYYMDFPNDYLTLLTYPIQVKLNKSQISFHLEEFELI